MTRAILQTTSQSPIDVLPHPTPPPIEVVTPSSSGLGGMSGPQELELGLAAVVAVVSIGWVLRRRARADR